MNPDEQEEPPTEEQVAQISDALRKIREEFDTDLVFEALMLEYFRYRKFMIHAHYEEGTVLEYEWHTKKTIEDDPDGVEEEIVQQLRKNDRGGDYSGTDRMK